MYKIVSIPQCFYEDRKTGTAGQRIEALINEMVNQGYEYVGVVVTSSVVHGGCCCCKTAVSKFENQLVFKK